MARASDNRAAVRTGVRLFLLVVLAAWVAGCPDSLTAQAPAQMEGLVRFPAGYQTQAKMTDVAVAATVSLIDPGTNTTIATALTDKSGSFIFSNLSGFIPPVDAVFILEAVKGLGLNLPGHDAVRVRTLIQWKGGGWTSISGGSIVISPGTTALTIIAALQGLPPAAFIGTLTPGSPDVFAAAGTGTSEADFAAVTDLVGQALEDNADPVAAIQWDGGAYVLVKTGADVPTILAILPAAMSPGGTVSVIGDRFSAFGAAGNVLTVGGATASILGAGLNSLLVRIPAGAADGFVSLTNSLGTATSTITIIPAFTPIMGGFGPEQFQPGYTTPGGAGPPAQGPVPGFAGNVDPAGSSATPAPNRTAAPIGGGFNP